MIRFDVRGRSGVLALATVAAVGLATAPALAQKTPRQSPMIATAFEDAYAYCMNVVDDPGMALDTFAGMPGWEADEPYMIGTTYLSVSASYYAEGGEAYFSAQVETYPTVMSVSCNYDVYGNVNNVDVAALVEPYGFDGVVEIGEDGGTYGVWELLLDDGLLLFRIEKYEGSLYIMIHWLGDPPAGGLTEPAKG
ncbi:MAG: hypothetical protein IT534_13500 [Bauldia sp.]|nr:hypothetical protein [Bauldia sp.]